MKRFLMLLLLPAAAIAQKPKDFKLHGDLKLLQPIDWVYVTYRTDDNTVTDSLQTATGTFDIKGAIAEPTLATVSVKYKPSGSAKPKMERIPVFLQAGKMALTAKDSLQNNTVQGSAAHTDYLLLKDLQKPYDVTLNKLYDEWSAYNKEKNKEAQSRVETAIDSVDNLMKENVFRAFATSHAKSPVALYAVKQYAGYDIDADKVEPLFVALPAKTQSWPSAVSFKESLAIAKKTGVGKMAMDFTQNDTLGMPVSLSQFKGKYVLVDFWASWCGPCRSENPNVVKAFNAYQPKGFTVLGVSLDRPNAKEKWLKAIHDDGLAWNHVSDLKFWDNAVAKQYGIRAIPQNFLIDPQGKIIAKNIRGEELQKKLDAVFNGQKTF